MLHLAVVNPHVNCAFYPAVTMWQILYLPGPGLVNGSPAGEGLQWAWSPALDNRITFFDNYYCSDILA